MFIKEEKTVNKLTRHSKRLSEIILHYSIQTDSQIISKKRVIVTVLHQVKDTCVGYMPH